MGHCLLSCKPLLQVSVLDREQSVDSSDGETYLMIISQQLIKKINCLITDESLVFGIDKSMPVFLGKPPKDVVVLGVEFNVIFVKVLKKIVRAQDFGNLYELIRIAVAMKKRFLPKNHRSKHRAQRPHIQRIVVLLEINEQFRALEISRRYSNIVLCPLMVEFGKSPVY